ncbi:MAG TPA: response regulator transcription factor [Saprospiraceae bacterium]|mgnify:CR=1 FL=1|nr:response regulator transcription factor [Saprospiraceae bacterium]HRO07956.1 response regulator transcription factor [Saprospiraceae bacterium]HRO73430.1 response regulator transcription factor [Saprospiraceae bacterium]HRP41451.1 response regulator transcription factor [Saprospiraceae bacterium]
MHILIIEDQAGLQEMVKMGLEEHGYQVSTADNGIDGLDMLLANEYSVAIVDLLLPGMNGLDICRKVRASGSLVPIIIVSALDSVEDRIAGLEVGADDYLPKPFNFSELKARLVALERRNLAMYNASVREVNDLVVNFNMMSASRANKNLDLTKKEFKLLEFFLQNENRVVTKSEIAEKVWDIDFDTGTNIVEVYVNYLRNKIDKGFDKKLIHTKFGVGYIFNPKQYADKD